MMLGNQASDSESAYDFILGLSFDGKRTKKKRDGLSNTKDYKYLHATSSYSK